MLQKLYSNKHPKSLRQQVRGFTVHACRDFHEITAASALRTLPLLGSEFVPNFVPSFPQDKRAARQQGDPFLWEAVPTEAKLSELSGARVWLASGAVKKVLG